MSQTITGLSVGSVAPDFELKDQHGAKVSLSSFIGVKNVVVLFIPFAFTGTCTGELCAIRDDLAAFQNDGVQVIAISCDSPFTQKVFAEREGFKFPVLADFWPHGAAAKTYQIFNEDLGCALRGTFIIDKTGVIRWAVVNGLGDARNNGDYKAAIAAL
ncbi:MAG: peroxiredoxin [Candidatus Planktophila sp.]|jgi:peroxiredoxin|nr:peroxiredoxin [Candidatus Planktophila sp.]